MFSHVVVGTNDLERAKRFYDAVFGALGHREGIPRAKGGYVYTSGTDAFVVARPIDRRPATHANGGTIGFLCGSSAQVQLWHLAGVEHGGVAVEDPPGVRVDETGRVYLAYIRDPDGNKLCAVHYLTD